MVCGLFFFCGYEYSQNSFVFIVRNNHNSNNNNDNDNNKQEKNTTFVALWDLFWILSTKKWREGLWQNCKVGRRRENQWLNVTLHNIYSTSSSHKYKKGKDGSLFPNWYSFLKKIKGNSVSSCGHLIMELRHLCNPLGRLIFYVVTNSQFLRATSFRRTGRTKY